MPSRSRLDSRILDGEPFYGTTRNDVLAELLAHVSCCTTIHIYTHHREGDGSPNSITTALSDGLWCSRSER
jgi:hypothetical protein